MADLQIGAPLRAHSKLGASKYYQWKACPGSVRLSEGITESSSELAAEGTRANELAEAILTSKAATADDGDMLDNVRVYTDYINSLRAMKPSFEAVEQKFHLKDYHPDLYGTADYVCYFSRVKTLHVVDLKFGRGIPVEAKGNLQLMYYGLGALSQIKTPIDKIVLTIVQPRCYHPDGPVRSCEVDSVELVEFGFELVDDAKKTEVPDAPIVAGDHCRFCPAASICPALSERALAVTEAAFQRVEEYDPEKLAKSLSLIPQIEAWIDAVNKFAYRQAEQGNPVPGYKLVQKIAREKWVEGTSEDTMWKEFRIDAHECNEVSLKSPAAVRKMVKEKFKGKYENILSDKLFMLDQLTQKVSSGLTLVPESDKRAAVASGSQTAFEIED